ncbi:MAG: FGGY family carbohydrate kinase [Spirochaetales bacterium]|uniref:FGGY family carbohydrate kinase n=1 Tax=Candidatus Thalassospirochaeta sargassi TaxID=3119039 RepID=A0AAJ1IHI3_9SPIO|nr:FGGY family carbohydrate kinase [Spirochaetales bacterium]
MASKLIGIDIGTQGTKAAIFSEDGRTLAESFRKSNLFQPEPGVVEEDPEEQLDAVCNTIKELIDKTSTNPVDIACIAIDGQMAGVIGVGDDGMNVTPYDSWLDTRCASYIKQLKAEAAEDILNKTGCAPSFNHGPKKIWWKHEQPDIYAKIKSFVQPGGYAVMRLCGLRGDQAFIDVTYLHFSGFADNRNSKWDEELCKRFDVDIEKLPRIVRPDQIMGQIIPEMAERTGLKAGTPVAAGCGDTAASFLSCGAASEGVCVDVAGTASVYASTTASFGVDEKLILGCGQSAVSGLWHPYAYINGGGMNLEWFRREIGVILGAEGLEFSRLNELAAAIEPRLDDPVFVPHLAGRNSPAQPDLRGSWAGLNWNHNAGHLFRGVCEGVALEYRIYQQTLSEMYDGFKPVEIRITGGGGKSAVWNKIKADVLQIPVIPVDRQEGAPLGSALIAGKAAGLFSDLKSAADSWIKKDAATMPSSDMAEHYSGRSVRYVSLMDALNSWAESL